MKKIILTLALVATLGFSVTSCSTDDSALETNTAADGLSSPKPGNGDTDLPKPTGPRL